MAFRADHGAETLFRAHPSGVRPIYLAPYRVGPKTPAIEKDKIDRMLKVQVIELAPTEWAAPIFSAKEEQDISHLCRLPLSQCSYRQLFVSHS